MTSDTTFVFFISIEFAKSSLFRFTILSVVHFLGLCFVGFECYTQITETEDKTPDLSWFLVINAQLQSGEFSKRAEIVLFAEENVTLKLNR